MASRDEGPGFWQTLPGILTGVAALIGAVTGLMVALFQAGVFGGGEPAAQATGAGQQTQAQPAGSLDPRMAGKWSGEARDANGTRFTVSLEIAESCRLERPCGSIRVSHVPCQGEIVLRTAAPDDYEFAVDNFTADSGADCTPGAGEHFRLLPDGTLLYTTTYDPKASAILQRAD